jgi:hypothetical protein
MTIPDGIAVILQQNMALRGLAEAFGRFEFALRDVLSVRLAGSVELDDLHAV